MSEPQIIKRAEWGARYRDGVGTRALPCKYGFFHHTVTYSAGAGATLAQDCAAVRNVEAVGNQRFGTMSYPYAITESGRIFQTLSENRIGAHTKNFNTTGTAITFIGNWEANRPNQKMLDAAAWLIRDLERRGVTTRSTVWRGHYQVAATACPGKYMKPELAGIVAAARAPITIPKEDDMPAQNKVLIAFVRPEKLAAAIAALAKLDIRAYDADADEARITRKYPAGSAQ